MQSDYHIEDLVFQDRERVIYRARGCDGAAYAIVRMIFPAETIEVLQEGSFERTFQELRALDHVLLRPVVDGGLDAADGYPWVAVRWWDGVSLGQRWTDGPLTEEEVSRLEWQAEMLIEYLSARAGALSFASHDIILTQTSDGQIIDTFSIDYRTWFEDRSESRIPGTGKSAPLTLHRLIGALRPVKLAGDEFQNQIDSKAARSCS